MLERVIPATMMLVLASGVCAAQTEGVKKGLFIGGGINTIDTDRKRPIDNNDDLPESDNYFLQMGYGFTENWFAELQYSDSYKDGSFTEQITTFSSELGSALDTTIDGDVSFKVASAFLAYRSSGDFYWKAKAGFMDAELAISITGSATHAGELIRTSESYSMSESGWAAGAGLGYSFGSSSIELEYITSDDKVGIDSVALGYNYWF